MRKERERMGQMGKENAVDKSSIGIKEPIKSSTECWKVRIVRNDGNIYIYIYVIACLK